MDVCSHSHGCNMTMLAILAMVPPVHYHEAMVDSCVKGQPHDGEFAKKNCE